MRRTVTTRAFTLIELLVVIGLMAVLFAAVLVAASTMIDNAKARRTSLMLSIVHGALEQFRDEQRESPTLARPANYRARYGFYPPDEMEVFTSTGVPPNGPTGSRAPGRATFVPATYTEMLFRTDNLLPDDEAMERRDQVAMLMAIREYSEEASIMLDHLESKNWVTPMGANGDPLQFLDRNQNGSFDPMEDEAVRYLVDDWNTPIVYMAQRDYQGNEESESTNHKSTNHRDWNEVSTGMVRLNGGQPILCSYGPDGPEQLTQDVVTAGQTPGLGNPPATLLQDWMDDDDARIDSPLNEDNLYSDPTLKKKLRRGSR